MFKSSGFGLSQLERFGGISDQGYLSLDLKKLNRSQEKLLESEKKRIVVKSAIFCKSNKNWRQHLLQADRAQLKWMNGEGQSLISRYRDQERGCILICRTEPCLIVVLNR